MEQNRSEENAKIALFMGAEYKVDDYGDMGYLFETPPAGCWNKGFIVNALQYHESWSWLMPVVERIESLGNLFKFTRFCDSDGFYCQIQAIDFEMLDCKRDAQGNAEYFIYTESYTKLSAVYIACIAFINWYNQNGNR